MSCCVIAPEDSPQYEKLVDMLMDTFTTEVIDMAGSPSKRAEICIPPVWKVRLDVLEPVKCMEAEAQADAAPTEEQCVPLSFKPKFAPKPKAKAKGKAAAKPKASAKAKASASKGPLLDHASPEAVAEHVRLQNGGRKALKRTAAGRPKSGAHDYSHLLS